MKAPDASEWLISPEQLAQELTDPGLLLVDTRDEAVYLRAHIPGAVNIQDIFYYLCTPETGGLPSMAAHFASLFGQAGLSSHQRVVMYEDAHDNGYGKSCRGWLLMQFLGHARVQVLHGGFQGWKVAGLPLESDPVVGTPTRVQADIHPGHIIGTDEMLARLTDPDTVIVDCRDYAEWLGANSSPYGYDYCPRKGRIPGAVWLEWYRLLEHHNRVAWFRSSDEIRAMCEPLGITPDKRIVVYCFKGARASNMVMALRRCGYPNVVNYMPSWNEWSRNPDLPVDEDYPEV